MVSVAVNGAGVQFPSSGKESGFSSPGAGTIVPQGTGNSGDQLPMRYILIFWGLPMGIFWGWYFLSYYDINFGMLFFSRLVHDFAFRFYGDMLGIEPTVIPAMVARACVIDTALIFAIFGFRKRREIAAWWRDRQPGLMTGASPEAGRVPPAE